MDDVENDVDNIIYQLKNQKTSINKTLSETIKPEIAKEDLEQIIMDNAAALVFDSIDMVQSLKTDVQTSGDSKMVEATAELIKAVTGALDTLAKLKLSDDKIKSQKEIKQMEIESKTINNDLPSNTVGILMSREDLIKNLQLGLQENKEKEYSEEKVVDV